MQLGVLRNARAGPENNLHIDGSAAIRNWRFLEEFVTAFMPVR